MSVHYGAATASPEAQLSRARETGMTLALAAVVVFLAVADGANVQLSLGYGLSVKNAILYCVLVGLAAKIVIQHSFELELRGLHAQFIVLIAYSMLSYVICAFVIDYSRYDYIHSAMMLKGKIVDHFIFFLVFFYGLRESGNAHRLVRFLLMGAVFANALAVLDALGFVRLGDFEIRDDGRVGGVIGESNQYGAYAAMLLPGMVAAALTARGIRRTLWWVGTMISAIALVMTVSRGAYVGVLIAILWASLLLPRHLPIGRIAAAGAIGLVVVIVVLAVFGASYGTLIADRVIGQSTSGDMVNVSSGRTEIWATALMKMAETPLTFLTGYGWDVYALMPFRYASHNHYLWFWFDLGLVGLLCGLLQFALPVRYARRALDRLPAEERPVVIAFIVGTLAFGIAAFFVNLFSPWAWFWAYAGLVMRIAVNARNRTSDRIVPALQESQPERANRFGWSASVR